MRLNRLDEVAGAVEVRPPDRVLVAGAEEGGEVYNGVDPVHGGRQRRGVVEVAGHRGDARGQRDIAAHERPAVEAGVREAGQQPRADQARGAGEQDGSHGSSLQVIVSQGDSQGIP